MLKKIVVKKIIKLKNLLVGKRYEGEKIMKMENIKKLITQPNGGT